MGSGMGRGWGRGGRWSAHGIPCWFSATGEGASLMPAVASWRMKGSRCSSLIFVFPTTGSFSAKQRKPQVQQGPYPSPHFCLEKCVEKTSYPSSHSWGGLSRWICAWRSPACVLGWSDCIWFLSWYKQSTTNWAAGNNAHLLSHGLGSESRHSWFSQLPGTAQTPSHVVPSTLQPAMETFLQVRHPSLFLNLFLQGDPSPF